jgi:hypothetical protein
MISIKDVHAIEERRRLIKKEIYSKIFEDLSRKIKNAVGIGHKQVILRVPTYMWGYPTYDIDKVITYMIRQFKNSGFTSYSVGKTEIYVSWRREKEKKVEQPTVEEEEFPTFVNLKRTANKLRNK